jgi:hypothetical protein
MVFDNNNMPKFLLMIGIILFASYVGKKYTHYIEGDETKNEYKMIQKYLLNESPLYGYNKPKLWVHTKYEYNTRNWASFQSRSSCDLNQPYIHLTIKSIVLHCGDDFNVCLIDDDTFSKLIPSWNIDMKMIADPLKTRYRDYGMAQLLYYYGGIVVPNTFVCRKNLKELWAEGTRAGVPFICEYKNQFAHSTAGGQESAFLGDTNYLSGGVNGLIDNAKYDLQKQSQNPTLSKTRQMRMFMPNTFFMGARKNDPVMLEMMEYLKMRDSRIPFSSESRVLGNNSQWCLTKVLVGKMTLIDGQMVGTKKMTDNKPILIEDLFEEGFLDIHPDSYGVYIPEDEVLSRNKYQWFAVMSSEEILNTRLAVAKYLVESVVNYLPPNKFVMVDDMVDSYPFDNTNNNNNDIVSLKEKTVFSI